MFSLASLLYKKISDDVKFGQWDDVESLIKELEQIEGIQSISKARFFLSPGLAPAFQV